MRFSDYEEATGEPLADVTKPHSKYIHQLGGRHFDILPGVIERGQFQDGQRYVVVAIVIHDPDGDRQDTLCLQKNFPMAQLRAFWQQFPEEPMEGLTAAKRQPKGLKHARWELADWESMELEQRRAHGGDCDILRLVE